MESNRKTILYGLLIAAILGGILYYFLREEPLADTRKEPIITRMAFTGSNLTEMQDGQKIWDLTARLIEVDSKNSWVYMTDLKGAFFRADGTKVDVLAKSAVIDPRARHVEMSEGISMKAEDGSSFTADKARYAAKERMIFASGSIRAVREDAVLTGNELETDDKFDTIVVKGNARIIKGGPGK